MTQCLEAPSKEIVRLRQTSKYTTGAAIAREVGVSRQFVAEVLGRHDLANAGYRNTRLCLNCGKKVKPQHKYCSRECLTTDRAIELKCAECSRRFTITQSQYEARLRHKTDKNFYCSYRCHGKHVGRKHGFGVHGKTRGRVGKKRVTVRWLRRLGFTLGEIQYITNYPRITIYCALRGYGFEPWEDALKRGVRAHSTRRVPIQHTLVRWMWRLCFTEKYICNYLKCSHSTYYRAVYLGIGRSKPKSVTIHRSYNRT